jgi:hypothetical protein
MTTNVTTTMTNAMTRSRYLGIPLLAAFSLGLSLALLPLNPGGANANDLAKMPAAPAAAAGPA